MPRKWTRVLALLMVLALSFSVVACSGGEDVADNGDQGETGGDVVETAIDGPVEVTFWHAMSSGHGPILEGLVSEFNDTNEFGITVTLEYQGGYGDLRTKLLGAIQAGNTPVMAQMYADWASRFIGAGALESLQPYVEHPHYGLTDAELADYVPVFIENCEWDGEVMTWPFNKSTTVLYWNTDLLDKAPETWAELLSLAGEATVDEDGDGSIDVWGMGLEQGVDLFFNFLYQAGGTILNEDETVATFNTDEGVEALQYIVDLVYKHEVAYINDGYMSGPFGDGVAAMYIGSSAGMPYVKSGCEGKHGWAMAPLPKGAEAAAEFMGTDVGIFAKASAAEKEAAWRFLTWLTNPENTAKWAVESGYLPVRQSATETEAWQNYLAEIPGADAGPRQFDTGFFTPKNEDAYSVRSIIADAYEKALLGELTPAEALAEAEEAVNNKLGD